jgi:hypothetical protein
MTEEGAVTIFTAITLGCTTLEEKIGLLVRDGHVIESDIAQSRNSFGEFTTLKRYWLRDNPPTSPKPLRDVFTEEPPPDIPGQGILFPEGGF